MAKINIKQLEAFIQAADQASFRGAAASLNTTQPNISARISALEEQLGKTLMVRNPGSVRLTPEGQNLLGKARSVIDAMDDFVTAAGSPGLFDSTLRLGATEMVAHSWLAKYLASLQQEFPNVKVEVTVDVSENLSKALFDHSIDLALQSGPYTKETTGMTALGSYPLVWVASPNLEIDSGILTLKDLIKFPILTHSRQTLPFQQLEKHLDGEREVRLVTSTNLNACLRLAKESLGIACVPKVMVDDDLQAGRLKSLRYLWLPDDLEFAARYHQEKASYYLRKSAELAGMTARQFGDFGKN